MKLYYVNHKSAAESVRDYKTRNSLKLELFAPATIIRMIGNFVKTKSLHDIPSCGKYSLEAQRAPKLWLICQ